MTDIVAATTTPLPFGPGISLTDRQLIMHPAPAPECYGRDNSLEMAPSGSEDRMTPAPYDCRQATLHYMRWTGQVLCLMEGRFCRRQSRLSGWRHVTLGAWHNVEIDAA